MSEVLESPKLETQHDLASRPFDSHQLQNRQQGGPADFRPDLMQSFIFQLIADMSGAMTIALCIVGDRLGLFRELATLGAATAEEFADRTGVGLRYAKEWLRALASAKYLKYDAATQRFTLPSEHALALVHEGGPMFMGGAFQQTLGLYRMLEPVLQDLRTGKGISQNDYDLNLQVGMERLSATWYHNQLLFSWIPAIPGLPSRLIVGASVADIGCGCGRAIIALAKAYPTSRFFGFDTFPTAIARANSNAQASGVADRVVFEVRDVLGGLPQKYDVVTVFNAAHDFENVNAAFQNIRRALKPDGRCIVLEPNCSESVENNIGPTGTIMHATSLLYSTPVSLANGGGSVGAMGLPETKLKKLCADVGFSSFSRVVDEPFNALYVASA
jgi:SAM-dependent methyltransferase